MTSLNLPESREAFKKRINSIGAQETFHYEKPIAQFQTLKRSKKRDMGKVLMNTPHEVEFFSLRD